jgi:hypothetical protein
MITTPNPFRVGSNLRTIFKFIADGYPHELDSIAFTIYGYQAYGHSLHGRLLRRRTASALRTIRAHPGLGVDFLPENGVYIMTEQPIDRACPFSLRPLQCN